MDGCFDMMHYGHANALRQVRSARQEQALWPELLSGDYVESSCSSTRRGSGVVHLWWHIVSPLQRKQQRMQQPHVRHWAFLVPFNHYAVIGDVPSRAAGAPALQLQESLSPYGMFALEQPHIFCRVQVATEMLIH
jgi:hypothetical protein